MANTRELSQLASLINVVDASKSIGVVTSIPDAKVGVGTAVPTSRVHVDGDAYVSGVVTATSFSGTATTAIAAGTAYGVTGSPNLSVGVVTATGGFNIGIQSGGISVTTGVVTALNFIGAGNTFNYNPSTKTVDISISGGSAGVVTSVIAGSGVSVTQSAGIVTVSVVRSGDIRVLDDISRSFNGITTSFAITSDNGALTPSNSQSLIISIGGVIQKPITDYYVSTSNIIFTSPPESNFSFFGIYFDLNLLGSNGSIDIIDDISGSFNGVTTSFAITSSGGAVSPNNAQALIVNLGGVVQSPSIDYTISGSNIVFTTAPTSGLSFSAVHFNVYSADSTVTPRMLSTGAPSWNSAGNLGVGTASPTSKISVVGDGNFTGVVTATSFKGSGANLTGVVTSVVAGAGVNVSTSGGQVTVSSGGGIGTAVSSSGFGANVFYTNAIGTVDTTTTLSSPDPTISPVLYTNYEIIIISEGVELIIENDNVLLTSALNLSQVTTT